MRLVPGRLDVPVRLVPGRAGAPAGGGRPSLSGSSRRCPLGLRLRAFVLPMLVLLASAAACAGTSAELAILQADPMADVELPSAQRLSLREVDAGTTLGKPVAATVIQGFILVEGASLATVLDEAVNAAAAAGWDSRRPQSPQDFWRGERETEPGQARLSIAINDGGVAATPGDLGGGAPLLLVQSDGMLGVAASAAVELSPDEGIVIGAVSDAGDGYPRPLTTTSEPSSTRTRTGLSRAQEGPVFVVRSGVYPRSSLRD